MQNTKSSSLRLHDITRKRIFAILEKKEEKKKFFNVVFITINSYLKALKQQYARRTWCVQGVASCR